MYFSVQSRCFDSAEIYFHFAFSSIDKKSPTKLLLPAIPWDVFVFLFQSSATLTFWLLQRLQKFLMVHDFSNLRENPFFTEILLFLRIGRGAVVDDDDTVALIIRRTRR